MNRQSRTFALVAAGLAGGLALACGRSASRTASAGAQRYAITGVIRSLDAGKPEVTLEHEPIEGFMDTGMTMVFPIHADAALVAGLATGDRISGTLVVDGGKYWIEGVKREAAASAPAVRAPTGGSATSSASATVTPHPNRGIAVGDRMPDFTLTDQKGRPMRLSDLAGEPVAVTFIYTRCPIATACPLTTAKFSKLAASLAAAGFGHLVTITVDPEHDTPSVLDDYAKRAGADPKRWKFLTGDPKAVADVVERFGVLYYPDKGQVVHQQGVAVLDAAGRLANIYYGEDWEPEHILRDMEKARKG
jgi:protein SCO1